MKTQRENLERALLLLDRDLIITGGCYRIKVKKDEWSGNRYYFLVNLSALVGHYDFIVKESTVDIKITDDSNIEKKMILLKDFL